jgi:hypothetical protein
VTPRKALKAAGGSYSARKFLEAVDWQRRNGDRAPTAVWLAVEREIEERAALLISEGVYMWDWPDGRGRAVP